MTIYSRQADVTLFYNRASLVICLTNPRVAIETFGLTTLEAMSAGLPVIVPTVGGIAEMVEDAVNGYKIDVQNLNEIYAAIHNILENRSLYLYLSRQAHSCSRHYSQATTIAHFIKVLENEQSQYTDTSSPNRCNSVL